MKIRRTVSVWQKDVLNRLKMLYDMLTLLSVWKRDW